MMTAKLEQVFVRKRGCADQGDVIFVGAEDQVASSPLAPQSLVRLDDGRYFLEAFGTEHGGEHGPERVGLGGRQVADL